MEALMTMNGNASPMVNHRYGTIKSLRRWSFAMICGVGVLLCSSPSALCTPMGFFKGNSDQADQAYRGARIHPPLLVAGGASSGKRGKNQTLWPSDEGNLDKKIQEWESLPPEQKNILRHRMNRWKELPPAERKLYRKRYDQLQTLPPHERQRIHKKLDNWNNLTPEEKEEILRRFRTP
ncbi:MAG: DUF3106 domain-containing protein [Deltaproteobacteria bacterium]|nr:DUF3106 domain-containing protein [Deltaproteobacteria bacterium]